jgi:hypothetical protein
MKAEDAYFLANAQASALLQRHPQLQIAKESPFFCPLMIVNTLSTFIH